MKVLVAGATGALGRALVPRLRDGGHSVLAVARHPSDAGIESIRADLLDDDLHELGARLRRGRPRRDCDSARSVGSRRLGADRPPAHRRHAPAARCRARLRRRALPPAEHRHGLPRRRLGLARRIAPLDESPGRAAVCRPVIEMEAMIRAVERERLAWTILRGGSFVGAGTGEDALAERLRRGDLVVAGDGSNYVSPVNVADMAAAFAAALERAPAGRPSTSSTSRSGAATISTHSPTWSGPPGRGARRSCRCRRRGAARTSPPGVLGWMPRGADLAVWERLSARTHGGARIGKGGRDAHRVDRRSRAHGAGGCGRDARARPPARARSRPERHLGATGGTAPAPPHGSLDSRLTTRSTAKRRFVLGDGDPVRDRCRRHSRRPPRHALRALGSPDLPGDQRAGLRRGRRRVRRRTARRRALRPVVSAS